MEYQGKAKSYEQLEAYVMSPFGEKNEELWWAKRRIEELLSYICEIRSENKIAKMTCPNCNIGKIHLTIHKMCSDCVNQQIASGKTKEVEKL